MSNRSLEEHKSFGAQTCLVLKCQHLGASEIGWNYVLNSGQDLTITKNYMVETVLKD